MSAFTSYTGNTFDWFGLLVGWLIGSLVRGFVGSLVESIDLNPVWSMQPHTIIELCCLVSPSGR